MSCDRRLGGAADHARHAAGVRALARGERTVSELAQPFAMSLAAASKHIKVLEHARLIRREVRGRTHVCRLDPGPLASAHQWLGTYEGFWTGRFDALERFLGSADATKSKARELKSAKGDER